MPKASCYSCGGVATMPYAEENGFALVKCRGCGLLFVENPPEIRQIADATRAGLHHGQRDLEVTGRFDRTAIGRYQRVLADLFGASLETKRSWLDVGCGHGEFVKTIHDVTNGRIKVQGVEPNVHKVASAQSRGLNVDSFELANHTQRYDVVSFLDVYSHLPDPPAFIESLKKLLTADGELVIQTGDAADFAPKEQFKPFGLPDHLSFASEAILKSMLDRLGFEVIAVRKYSYLRRDPISIAKEVVKLFLPGYHSRLRAYFDWEKYSKSNMYIRARLLPSNG